MSAPRRWLESEEASAEALELLRAGRPPQRMDDAVRRRSRQRVVGLAVMPAAAAGLLASWSQLALGALLGTAGTVAVMSALSVVGAPATTPPRASVTPPSAAPSLRPRTPPSRPVPLGADADAGSSERSAPTPPSNGRVPVTGSKLAASEAPPLAPAGDGLPQEIQLLEEARSQLGREPAQAERILLEHARRFPRGQLRVEREFLLIDALVRLGRKSEAEARARVLEGQAPTSLYGERLDQILGRAGANGASKKTDE